MGRIYGIIKRNDKCKAVGPYARPDSRLSVYNALRSMVSWTERKIVQIGSRGGHILFEPWTLCPDHKRFDRGGRHARHAHADNGQLRQPRLRAGEQHAHESDAPQLSVLRGGALRGRARFQIGFCVNERAVPHEQQAERCGGQRQAAAKRVQLMLATR
eukprot:2804374-Prymnesium_polylepis.1